MAGVVCTFSFVLIAATAAVLLNEESHDSKLHYLVLGDWGGLPETPYRTDIERYVAAALNVIATDYNTSFQLALGDNFYYDGVKDVNDKRFQETFETVFTGAALQNNWYFVAGNHDWHANVSAQIAYSQVSKRWNYPDYYYTESFISPDGATLQIVMIDTIILCGQVWSDFDGLSQPAGPEDIKMAEDEWKWIEKTLSASSADYLVVAGHYPIYSIAEHGPTKCLVDTLRPLLYKYNATAYLSGHDHNLQHLNESEGMNYFVVGSANFIDNSTKNKHSVPAGSLKFLYSDQGGFALVGFNTKHFELRFVNQDNKELYYTEMLPRKKNSK